MQIQQRIDLIRLYQKLENDPFYSKKLGIKVDFHNQKDGASEHGEQT